LLTKCRGSIQVEIYVSFVIQNSVERKKLSVLNYDSCMDET